MKSFFTTIIFVLAIGISNAQIISTYAGTGVGGFSGMGGVAKLSKIGNPGSGTFDKHGNYYFVSASGNRAFKINKGDTIYCIAGTGAYGYNGDSILAIAAKLSSPAGIATDTNGNIYISESGGNRIRMIDTSGVITTIAGTGIGGYNGDGILAVNAQINDPGDICIDSYGNLFISDFFNNRVRKVSPSGTITTFAGNGTVGYSGDSSRADTSKIEGEYGLCSDTAGNIYISSNMRVIKVDKSGIMTTIAGTGLAYIYNGDGIAATKAQIGSPLWIKADNSGNIYIADRINNRVRKVDAFGIIHTVAGNGTTGHGGDGGNSDSAGLSNPDGIALDSCGNLYIPMANDNRIRKVTFDTTCGQQQVDTSHNDTTFVKIPHANGNRIIIAPNPASNSIDLIIDNFAPSYSCYYAITDITGRLVKREKIITAKQQIDISNLQGGIYFIEVDNGEQRVVKKFVKD
jgi:hypothetical protein